MDLFEAMYTQRAMRRLKPDPVPDELIWRILDAAIHAPNGGNLQPWNFIVVKDRATKERLHEFYLDGQAHVTRPNGLMASNSTEEARAANQLHSSRYLSEHLADIPVLIIPVVRLADIASTTPWGACIFPAVQNLMLAARALGLGTTLTTLHRYRAEDTKKLLGIPDGWEQAALIPIGWPAGRFGPNRRDAVDNVVSWDHWGVVGEREGELAGAR
jgi:nitroreductase